MKNYMFINDDGQAEHSPLIVPADSKEDAIKKVKEYLSAFNRCIGDCEQDDFGTEEYKERQKRKVGKCTLQVSNSERERFNIYGFNSDEVIDAFD